MPDLFFYGTLRDRQLLDVVLGETADCLTFDGDALLDHQVLQVDQGPFPMIIAAPGQSAEGLLVRGLTDAHIKRLTFYEAGFDYDLRAVSLASGAAAQMYFPAKGVWSGTQPWDFDAWQAQWGALSAEAAREVMSLFGTASPAEVAARFPRIRARAQSRLNAAQSRHGAGTLHGRVEVLHHNRSHSGFYALDAYELRHETFSGSLSAPIRREIFVTTDAALVLPYDPGTDLVALVEQFRMGPFARQDGTRWQMEPIAGLIDPGETPETTAIREAREEANLEITALLPVAQGYSSPGGSTDFHYLFVGLCGLEPGMSHVGGVDLEGEDIRLHVIPFDELLTMAEDLRIGNTPLSLAIYWLAHHRTRLRSG